jgi:putative tryptophan/tyrosine transport system permease protein
MMYVVVQGIIERGLLYSLVIGGVYLSSRIIRFDDLSIEGAFGFGGALMACGVMYDINPWLSLVIAAFGGALAGFITGVLNTQLRLRRLISGLVVTTGLFSINLVLAGANQSIFGKSMLINYFPDWLGDMRMLIILLVCAVCAYAMIMFFLKTEVGFLAQAVGTNQQMLINLGKHVDWYITGVLMLANSLAGIAGALLVQYGGFFSLWSNIGVLLSATSALMIAEIFERFYGFNLIVGSIIYQALVSVVFEFNLPQEWNKLLAAVLIIVLMMIKKRHVKGRRYGSYIA